MIHRVRYIGPAPCAGNPFWGISLAYQTTQLGLARKVQGSLGRVNRKVEERVPLEVLIVYSTMVPAHRPLMHLAVPR